MSLGTLACLPLDERAAFIERSGRGDLTRAIEALQRAGSPSGDAVTPRRLAWAMAYNLRRHGDADGTGRDGLNPRLLGGSGRESSVQWTAETPWTAVWAFYSRQRQVVVLPGDESPGAVRTQLRELARAVACEQRSDWPWAPEPVDQGLAAICRNEVFELSYARVRGVLTRRARPLAAPRDEIVNEAWARAIGGAWGARAATRFLGRSLISSWLCAIALNTARNRVRIEARQRRYEQPWSDGYGETLALQLVDVSHDPAPDAAADVGRRFRECVDGLKDRDRELLRLLIVGRTPSEIAAARGTKPPTVTQHQERIVRELRRCFGERRMRPGTTQQKVLKAFRGLLVTVGGELFPSLAARSGES